MSCRRVLKSIQALAAHSLLFCFTLLLVLKLDHTVSCSWWLVSFFLLSILSLSQSSEFGCMTQLFFWLWLVQFRFSFLGLENHYLIWSFGDLRIGDPWPRWISKLKIVSFVIEMTVFVYAKYQFLFGSENWKNSSFNDLWFLVSICR